MAATSMKKDAREEESGRLLPADKGELVKIAKGEWTHRRKHTHKEEQGDALAGESVCTCVCMCVGEGLGEGKRKR